MSIKTNNQARNLLYLSDFSEREQTKIRENYDWMDKEDIEYNYGFFRYRGIVYHLQDFQHYSGESWDGCYGLNYFASILIKLTSDCNHVIVGFHSV